MRSSWLFLFAAVAGAQTRGALDIESLYPAAEALYLDLHAHPELAFEETRTAGKLADHLRGLGFDVTAGVGRTGIVGLLRNGPGPTLMLRTELDALPVEEKTGAPFASKVVLTRATGERVPVMHACGHDLHMAAWAATARWMAEHKAAWSGTLMMVGQPAEEGNAGARAMLQDGLFTRFPRPDFALSFHDDDGLPSGVIGHHAGPFRSMSDAINITLYGRGGHAAMPHNTIDPVVMAAKLVLSLQTLVSRENNPVEPAVLTVSRIQAGTAGNAIPDEAQLQVSLRTYTEAQRKKLVAGIERMARAEAAAAGAPKPPVIQYRSEPGKVVVNDAALTARLAKALGRSLGEANVREMPRKMTSEDFAEYGAAGIPSVLLHIGAVDPAKLAESERTGIPGPAPHSPGWLPDLAPTLRALIRAEIAAAQELLAKR